MVTKSTDITLVPTTSQGNRFYTEQETVISQDLLNFTSKALFLVQKENCNYQAFINLYALNWFLGKESFKMEGMQVVKSLIQQGGFMIKLNLKDAYYAPPIHPSHRKYPRFIYQNRTYEFQCLPWHSQRH